MKLVENISKEQLLQRVSQEEIMERYFGQPIKIGSKHKYLNPFRPGDKKPGCFFNYNSSGTLRFFDYTQEKQSFDCFEVAQWSTGLSFSEVLSVIYDDMKVYTKPIELYTVTRKKEDTDIRVRLKLYEDHELKYWEQYGIDIEILRYFNVRACEKVWINGRVWKVSKESDPIFRYKQKDRFKIYCPLSDSKDKWRNNYHGGLLDGWEQLPVKGDTVFLLKGLKDVMSVFVLGDTSVAVRSETTIISKNALELLKARFQRIIPWMDNDKAGLDMLQKYEREYGLIGIHNPIGKPKDPSDWIKENKSEYLQWRNGLKI